MNSRKSWLAGMAATLASLSLGEPHAASSDADWVALNPGMPGANGRVYAFASDSNGNVYAGGQFYFIGTVRATNIAKWNGTAWSPLGPGLYGDDAGGTYVSALAVSGTNLYAGGSFYQAGGVLANSIARWDGNRWWPLGGGIQQGYSGGLKVNALALLGSDLYVGGNFINSRATNIARWDGSQWWSLGNPNDSVNALAVSGGNLYVGGYFTWPASRIARWDGSAWWNVGSGMKGDYYPQARYGVFALAPAATPGILYAAGAFTNAGGVSVNNIARWDGSAWSALGSGMSDSVYTLASSGTYLYAAGSSANAAGMPITNIAKWDGASWSALSFGSPLPYVLSAIGTNLYAGGDYFWQAGGAPADNIARWDGTAWSALGPLGIDSGVAALAVAEGNLYVAGKFQAAVGVPAKSVAKWDGNSWTALGSGVYPGSEVSALLAAGTNLYVGGSFTAAGGVAATNIAKWDGKRGLPWAWVWTIGSRPWRQADHISTLAAPSRRLVGCRPTSLPGGTAAPGRLWARACPATWVLPDPLSTWR